MKKSIIISVILIFAGVVNLFPGLDFNVRVSSYYIWRGFNLNPSKEIRINPYANLAIGDTGLSVTGWGSFAMDEKKLREIDLTLTYAFKLFPKLLIKVGVTNYRFYNIQTPGFFRENSQEAFVSVGLPWILLQPELTTYYDFGAGDGFYFKFKVEHVVEIFKFVMLELYSSIGYNNGQWLPEGAKRGFSDFNFTGMLPIKLGRIYLIPFISYTAVLLDSIGDSRYLWYGISFGY